jgi:hypothetical protein
LLVFLIREEKVNLILFNEVINNPDSAPLSSPLGSPPNLPKATASSNDFACLRIECELNLKSSKICILKQFKDLLGKYRSFDEMHTTIHTPMAHRCKILFLPNAKLTHGSLEAAGGSKTGQGEGAEAAQAASVTEPVELWPRF